MQSKLQEKKNYLLYLDNLSQQSVIQRKVISELNNKVIEARDKLIEASRSKKIIEKLRDKKFKQYNQDLLKQENKVVNEIVTTRFARKDS